MKGFRGISRQTKQLEWTEKGENRCEQKKETQQWPTGLCQNLCLLNWTSWVSQTNGKRTVVHLTGKEWKPEYIHVSGRLEPLEQGLILTNTKWMTLSFVQQPFGRLDAELVWEACFAIWKLTGICFKFTIDDNNNECDKSKSEWGMFRDMPGSRLSEYWPGGMSRLSGWITPSSSSNQNGRRVRSPKDVLTDSLIDLNGPSTLIRRVMSPNFTATTFPPDNWQSPPALLHNHFN